MIEFRAGYGPKTVNRAQPEAASAVPADAPLGPLKIVQAKALTISGGRFGAEPLHRIDVVRVARGPGQPPRRGQGLGGESLSGGRDQRAKVACVAPALELLRHERHLTGAPLGAFSLTLSALLLTLEAGAPLRMRLALLLLGIDHDVELLDERV